MKQSAGNNIKVRAVIRRVQISYWLFFHIRSSSVYFPLPLFEPLAEMRPDTSSALTPTPLVLDCSTVITTTSAIDAERLVDALVSASGGAVIRNPTLTGPSACAGTFVTTPGGGYDLPASGVILSSGNIQGIQGPNQSGGAASPSAPSAGDSDLDLLIPGFTTKDACILEFDLTCPEGTSQADGVTFNYVFLSEEYNEYVGDDFNDVVGFFLNDGPNNNIALLPDGSPVSVNNVNNGLNSDFYIDNGLGHICIEADGFTTLLTE